MAITKPSDAPSITRSSGPSQRSSATSLHVPDEARHEPPDRRRVEEGMRQALHVLEERVAQVEDEPIPACRPQYVRRKLATPRPRRGQASSTPRPSADGVGRAELREHAQDGVTPSHPDPIRRFGEGLRVGRQNDVG